MNGDISPLRWRVQRLWAQGSAPWWALSGGSAALFAVVGASLVTMHHAKQARADIDRQIESARAGSLARTSAVTPVGADFVAHLRFAVLPTRIVNEIQRACADAGVALATMQVQEQPPSHDRLGRTEFALTLRGPYPATKQVIKQVVERFPDIGVPRLRMRQAQAPSDVETSITLSLWTAPVSDDVSSAARSSTARP